MKKVLICALDWGLGHATRIIPVIHEFKRQHAEIRIGSSGSALALLRLEFPDETFLELPAYHPSYSSHMMLAMAVQMPKFLRTIREEHQMVEAYVLAESIDIVVSDNRFGCWSGRAFSVFITHQPQLVLPSGYQWLAGMVNRRLNSWIAPFSLVWIPDQEESGLTQAFVGDWKGQKQYIGWLSRFKKEEQVGMKYDLIALVSGPEPHRAQWEALLTRLLVSSDFQSLMVTGKPEEKYHEQEGHLEKINHLQGTDLSMAIQGSGIVISRSGYSTIMDLIALGKQAIFVPTPQQPEQIHLANYLMERKIAFKMDQRHFALQEAMAQATNYKGLSVFQMQDDLLSKAVSKLLK